MSLNAWQSGLSLSMASRAATTFLDLIVVACMTGGVGGFANRTVREMAAPAFPQLSIGVHLA
jgi:hypothetical protein